MKNNTTKRAFFISVISTLVCISMLVGSTFAWFTDSVTAPNNKIVAGNLDVEVYHTNRVDTEEKVEETTLLFDDVTLWEPGAVAYENFTIKNKGSLALEYLLSINFSDYNYITDNNKSLKDILKIAVVDGSVTTTGSEEADRKAAILMGEGEFKAIGDFNWTGCLENTDDQKEMAFIIWWEPSSADNDFNVNNTRSTSDAEPLHVQLGINLFATQYNYETDSFGKDYDEEANIVPAVELPEAAVEDLGTLPAPERTLTFDMNGTEVDATLPVMLKFDAPSENLADKEYKDWNADFVVKFSRDVDANQVVFAGYHERQGMWVPLPLTRDVKAGEEIRVMSELFVPAMDALGLSMDIPDNAGLGYEEIKTYFSPFTCGLLATSDFIKQNEDVATKEQLEAAVTQLFVDMGFEDADYSDTQPLEATDVTLELRMYSTVDGENWAWGGIEDGISYVLDSFTYTIGE